MIIISDIVTFFFKIVFTKKNVGTIHGALIGGAPFYLIGTIAHPDDVFFFTMMGYIFAGLGMFMGYELGEAIINALQRSMNQSFDRVTKNWKSHVAERKEIRETFLIKTKEREKVAGSLSIPKEEPVAAGALSITPDGSYKYRLHSGEK